MERVFEDEGMHMEEVNTTGILVFSANVARILIFFSRREGSQLSIPIRKCRLGGR